MPKRSAPTQRVRRRKPRLGRPPGSLSDDTRRRILRAARDCFAALGFERATNRHIAAEAGLTAAAIYRHYDSKSELYAAVVRYALNDVIPHLQAVVAGERGPRAALRALVRANATFDEGQRAAVRFLSAIPTEMQRHPQISQLMLADPGAVFTLVSELIETGVRSGEIPKGKAPRALALMIAALMGINAYATALGPTDSELAIAGFVDLLDGTLFRERRKS